MDHFDQPVTTIERHHMLRAIELAENGRLNARPNPVVGAVLAQGETVLGEAWHDHYGGLHAERALVTALLQALPPGALLDLGPDVTLYVSLEPCAHQGKQPPCTDAILEAGIKRVMYAVDDTNPQTAGIGPRQLEAAGVEVIRAPYEFALLAMRQNAGFHSVNLRRRPFVTYKFATTADGFLATGMPDDRWISGADSRAQVQVYRALSGAVLVGIETVIADDCLLTVRNPDLLGGLRRHPLRVVVDRSLRMPLDSELVKTSSDQMPVLVICGPQALQDALEALEQAGVTVWRAPSPEVSARSVLEYLASVWKINDLLLESGPTLAAAWHSMGMIDALVHYRSARLLEPLLSAEVASLLPRIDEGHPLSLPLVGAEETPVGDDTRREAVLRSIAAQS